MKSFILFSIIAISFTSNIIAQDTMYIVEKGGLIHYHQVDVIDSIIFTKPAIAESSLVEDVDGNTYETVQIGNQIWMADNLKVTQFNDGTEIDMISTDLSWSEAQTPAYCYYDNDTNNLKIDGALYNRLVVSAGLFNDNNICPTGWHVPGNSDWDELAENLGGAETAGEMLKSPGWDNGDYCTSNIIQKGFWALPTGYRIHDGTFLNNGESAYFWTLEESETFETGSRFRIISSSSTALSATDWDWFTHGFSIRCVKDSE